MTRTQFFKELRLARSKCRKMPFVHYIVEVDETCVVSTFSYQQVYLKSSKLAKWLLTNVKMKRILIAIDGDVQEKWVVPMMLAIWKSGNSVLPVNQSCLNFEDAKYCISKHRISKWRLFSVKRVYGRRIYLWKRKGTCFKYKNSWDMAYSLTTSGSTGKPKQVQVPWACIYPNAIELRRIFQLTSSDTVFLGTPPSFDPFFIELFCAITVGASMVVCDRHLLPLLTEESSLLPKITFLQTTPSLFITLPNQGKFILSKSSSVRNLVIGGEPFPEYILKHKENKTNVFNIYGITEISCWAFICKIIEIDNISLGQPLSGIVFKIIDGELVIGSTHRRCIVGHEEKTHLDDICYRKTGDIVTITENGLTFIGRKDNIVKRFGTKVSVEKVQRVLHEIEGVKSSCVTAFADKIAWCLVLHHSSCHEIQLMDANTFQSMYSKIFSHLNHFEYPEIVVELPEIPLNCHGKTDVRCIRALLAKFCSKISQTQRAPFLFEILWRQVLGREEIHREKSFIESGGSSILAMNLISALGAYGLQVPPNLMAHLLGNSRYDQCLLLFTSAESFNSIPRLELKLRIQLISIVWKYDFQKCVDATPTVLCWQGVKYVAVGSHSSQLSLIRVDNGRPIWTTHLGDRIESGICPGDDGNVLLVGCYDHCIYCLRTETGDILWKFKTSGMVKSTPILCSSGTRVLCGSYDKKFYSLDLKNGCEKLSMTIDNGSFLSRPLLNNGLIFVPTLKGTFACISPQDFSVVWKKFVERPIFSSPCFLGSAVVFAEVGGSIFCCCSETGNEKWKFTADGNIFSGLTVLTLRNEEFITFGCHDSCLYLLTQSGSLRWKTKLDSPVYATPAVADSRIVCASTKGCVYVLNDSGEIITYTQLSGEVFSSPALAGNRIFVGCRDNNLYCLSLDTKAAPD